MAAVGFFITLSNISHHVLSFALPLLNVVKGIGRHKAKTKLITCVNGNLHRSPGGLHNCPCNLTSV